MNNVNGGAEIIVCTCSCFYANSGGASSAANAEANAHLGPNGGSSTVGHNGYVHVIIKP